MLSIRRFATADASADQLLTLRRLLVDAFEGDFSDDDWDHACSGTHVVVEDFGIVVAHAAVVPRVLEIDDKQLQVGYVEAVAVAPPKQGQAIGTLIMDDVAGFIRTSYVMGGLSTSRHGFYERLGWERWQGPTFVRHANETIRSADEDDGVMVLRFGSSKAVDLTAPISCEARSGDDW
jgi:aminoglycoside 2'-N-acetyltransferase I